MNLDFAPHFLDIASHNIHSHAPSGDICDLFGGRKTGGKDEFKHILFVEVGVWLYESTFHRFRQNAISHQALPVVLDLDDDESALMKSTQRDGAGSGFAVGDPPIGRLNAMVG